MKKQLINIIYFIIFLFIWIWLLFFINSKNSSNEKILDNQITKIWWKTGIMHMWKDSSEILNEENYKKIWINPNKYNTFENFLTDLRTFSWITIDPINQNFSIKIKEENWKSLIVPFRFQKNKEAYDDKINKNLAILDIYKAYKEWNIYWWADSNSGNKIIMDDERQHPQTEELRKIWWRSENVNKVISDLEKSSITKEKKELLSYLYDFTWDYKKANESRGKLCSELNDCKEITLHITWKVLDQNSKPVEWAKIDLLNNDKFTTKTWKDWDFNMEITYFPFTHLRFKASRIWYSDWFYTYSLNEYTWEIKDKPIIADFTVNSAKSSITVNDKTVSKYKKWKYYIIEDEHSKYMIPTDWLYYFDWEKYSGENFDVYLYFFTKSDNTDNLLNNDTFEPVAWYVWNLMKTFWMPYIQFVDKDTKKELFVKSSNPMILQNHIYHMKELYENHDKIYTALTKEDMKYLVKVSSEKGGYPIDFDFLTTNNFLRWPAWWALDRKTWIWWNVWMKVLDESWLVELPFFSIKDN